MKYFSPDQNHLFTKLAMLCVLRKSILGQVCLCEVVIGKDFVLVQSPEATTENLRLFVVIHTAKTFWQGYEVKPI